jgi:hypothetical protein
VTRECKGNVRAASQRQLRDGVCRQRMQTSDTVNDIGYIPYSGCSRWSEDPCACRACEHCYSVTVLHTDFCGADVAILPGPAVNAPGNAHSKASLCHQPR